MRLGGNCCVKTKDPEVWAKANIDMGYRATYFPLDYTEDVKLIDSFVDVAKANDLVIAEVGIWANTISPDKTVREEAVNKAIKKLELADYIKAKCCVNVSGSCTDFWYGAHIDNYSDKIFEQIVTVNQKIIDAVNPKHAFLALEPMPWTYPDTADSYLRLINAMQREHFGVHVDMVNVINSPEKYFNNRAVIKEWFDKLSPYIKSCHAKDTIIGQKLTLHLDECRPGTGNMDYEYWLQRMSELDADTPIMLEHMSDPNDFIEAVKFIKATAAKIGVTV